MRPNLKTLLQGLLFTTPVLLLALASCGGGGGGGSSTPAPVVVSPPAAPASVVATNYPGCTAQVKITWTASTGATNYNIYQSAASGVAGTKVNSSTITASPYVDSGLNTANTYYYTVTAVNSGGSSPASSETTGVKPTAGSACTSLGGSIQKALTLTPTVSTFAGTSGFPGSTDGTGTGASFNQPTDVTTDGTNLYVVDTVNNSIRKIVIATGVVSKWGTISNPRGITTDGINLYVTSVNTGGTIGSLSTISSSGVVATLTLSPSFVPAGITWDGTNLYVVDTTNKTIAEFNTTGTVLNASFATGFTGPQGITYTGGNFYIADAVHNTIDQVPAGGGLASVFAGPALGTAGFSDGSTGASALFDKPTGITTDGTNLYVADTVNNKIRKIVIGATTTSGAVTTVAGTGVNGGTDGPGVSATFSSPNGITTNGTSLYNVDTGKNTIRQIQ